MVISNQRLARVFLNGFLFAWIHLGLLWSFQSYRKWHALSFQLEKEENSI